MNWRENPQRVAWLVVMVSFSFCCLLAVAVPLGARSYLLNATRPVQSYVTVTAGTVQFLPSGAEDPSAVTDRRAVAEGGRIVTDANARALLTSFVDDPSSPLLATIQLYQDTDLWLTTARAPRFSWNDDPTQLAFSLQKGRVSISAQDAGDRPVQMRLNTPHGSVTFGDGSYDISIEGDTTLVRARTGAAQVLAANRVVTANSGERVSITAGGPPELPVPAALNQALNGKLEGRLSPLWQEVIRVGGGLTSGNVTQETVDQRPVVRFSRKTEDGAHNEAGLKQDINRDVQGYDLLTLRLDLKLRYQSVPGGGYLASEYPVMVDIGYTDIYGKD
ncbi:MAG: hypothetical protein QG637_109, partial [Chloroflexota bacterium]|nr:hypothetical protein [Chloroflexota bacterium]